MGNRKFQPEHRAFARRRGVIHRALHIHHQLAGNSQAQPGASVCPPIRSIRLGEFLEDPLPEFRGNALAMIANAEPDAAFAGFREDVDPSVPGENFMALDKRLVTA